MQESTPTEELNQQQSNTPFGRPPIIESTIAESEVTSTEPPAEPDISKHPTVPLRSLTPPRRYFRVNWWSVIALGLLLILAGEHTIPFLLPVIDEYFHPKATVTLFPTHKRISLNYSYLVVTGTADPSHGQIPSRIISFTTPTKSETINTTGIGYTPAIQARGTVTFYNEAPYSQTIYAGTVITQFMQDAAHQFSSNFVRSGSLVIAKRKITLLYKTHFTYKLAASVSGTLIFHLTSAQVQILKRSIAGKSLAEAHHELLEITGVEGVYIQPARQSDLSLPTDPTSIVLLVSERINT